MDEALVRPPAPRFSRRLLLGAALAIALLVALAGYLSLQRLEGFSAPTYSPDGRSLYFVRRDVTGIVWGFGVEHFTPPAHVYVMRDRISVRRLDLESGQVEVLRTWAASPLRRRRIDGYRGRLFPFLDARLGFTGSGEPQYVLQLSVPHVPSSEPFWTGRLWDGPHRTWIDTGSWRRGSPPFAFEEGPVLSSDWEVMTVKGRDALPAAIIAFNQASRTTRVLLRSRDFDRLYPNGVPVATIREQSRRARIERLAEIKTTHEALIERFRREGQSEIGAWLRAGKEMERLGYYPKEPTITAVLLGDRDQREPETMPTFEVSEAEMQRGVLHDIEQAIAAPGTAVDKDIGDYIVHRDYTTSQRLNNLLRSGRNRFRVRYGGQVYELSIERP